MCKIFFILLAFMAVPACSACIISEGNYINAGGSESSINLRLHANKTLSLEYATWQPGHYKNRKISTAKGSWSCKQSEITLEINGKTEKATLIIVGQNPLGINENSIALSFDLSVENKKSYLSNEILYPESVIKD